MRLESPFFRAEPIFPLNGLHNHGSCVVQCPNGDLLACWYRGSGERRADDVQVLGARLRQGSERWSEPFLMAEFPGFPDCNPCMTVTPEGRLWLFWPVILANEWHTALLMSRVSDDFQRPGPVRWTWQAPVLLRPGDEFVKAVEAHTEAEMARLPQLPADQRGPARQYLETRLSRARDKYYRRMGWMPRAHAVVLRGGRLLLPLYSDGFDFSLMALSDDGGETWRASAPILGLGPVQPSVLERKDGSLVAYMRDNGPPPQRLQFSESRDGGETWSVATDTSILNPGGGSDAVRLRSGAWVLLNNDTEKGRHSMLVSLSDDEGKSWKWSRHLGRSAPEAGGPHFAYPSVIQAADGSLHATYTYTIAPGQAVPDAEGRPQRETVAHAHFNEAWIRQGD